MAVFLLEAVEKLASEILHVIHRRHFFWKALWRLPFRKRTSPKLQVSGSNKNLIITITL